jgi:TonB family protein
MEFLSLQDPVAPEPARRLTRTEAIVASLGLHLLLLLLFLYAPGRLPESVVAFLRPRLPRAALPAAAAPAAPESQPVPPAQAPKIPLKFAYVKVPNDVPSARNPQAPLLSDKNRRARQEMPTPPDARQLSIDPHSEGTSLERERPDPSRPEGRDNPEVVPPPPGRAAGGEAGGSQRRSGKGEPGAGGPVTADGRGRPATGSGGGADGTPGPLGDLGPPGEGKDEGPTGDPREDLKQALSDIETGEYKFTFKNPAYLRGGSYGTMSFDTQDFPWGDYARRLYVIIRNNWLSRIPLAAREGIRGYVCWRFVIQKNGVIAQVLPVRGSQIPPFDRAASDAIRASSPLPPLPPEFPRDREGVTFCFYYNMYPGEAE